MPIFVTVVEIRSPAVADNVDEFSLMSPTEND